MISDVPIGAFLSGGVDSGTVVALMSRHSTEPVNTCCIGFGGDVGGYLDEREYANEVAKLYSTNHREYVVTPNVQDILTDIVGSFDEPFADHSTVPSYYLCKMTRERVTVALSGLGGDEMFGGYERYLGFKLSTYYNLLPRILREEMIKPLIEKIPERADGHYTVNHLKRFVRSGSLPQDQRYFGFLSMLDVKGKKSLFNEPEKYQEGLDRCRELVLKHFNSPNAHDPLDRVFYCDIKTYVPEDILACTDRMSMRHSLEVRVPFLDHKFVEFCATIPNEMKITFGERKHILKKAVSGLLPVSVFSHRKQGFVGPLATWLRSDLKYIVQENLSERQMKRHGLLSVKEVADLISQHFALKQLNEKMIWAILSFQIWFNLYIEKDGDSTAFHSNP
jgi:asparagine synthase (glutamine-hydrolysing)